MTRERAPRRRPSARRIGRAVALAGAALAALLAAEAACRVRLPAPPPLDPGLRYLAIESRQPFFEEEVLDGVVWRRKRPRLMNKDFKRFRLAKDPGAVRIFIVGESVAAHFANARSIEALVARLSPGRTVEVINCGMPGYRIHHWLPTALEVLEYDPDFLVVMSGNNEIGPPKVWKERSIRWRERLKRSRLLWTLVRAADRWSRARPRRPAPPADEAANARFYEERLERLAAAARKAGCRLVLCALPVNSTGVAPLSSLPQDDAAFRSAFRSMGAGRHREAAEAFEAVLRAEPDHPLSHYYAGLCSAALSDEGRARAHFDRALASDERRSQHGYVLAAIERRARAPDAVLADLSAAFRRQAGTPLLGRETFMDEFHWWPEFYALTSRVIVEAMGLDRNVDWDLERRRGWQAEGRIYAQTGSPGADYLLKKALESLSAADGSPWFEENAVQALLTLLERPGEPALSLSEARVRRLIRERPPDAGAAEPDLSSFYVHLAEAHRRRGEAKAARAVLDGLVGKEAPASALMTQGLLLERSGRRAAAEKCYREHREAVDTWRAARKQVDQ